MAIFLPRSDSVILEVTKSGSKWVRAAVTASGIPHEQIGPAELRGHGTLAVHGRQFRFICCFVRNPLTWYASYWGYRMAGGWRTAYTLDARCQHESFRQFIRSAVAELPGFLTRYFEEYTGPLGASIDFVGRQESLADDLVRALEMAGEDFDEVAIRATAPTNVGTVRPEGPDIGEDTAHLLTLSEWDAMRRFGYVTSENDPLQLAELYDRYPEHGPHLRRIALWTERAHWEFDDRRGTQGRPTSTGRRLARTLTNFGLYFEKICGALGQAEQLYARAARVCPEHPRTLGTYAAFLHQIRGEFDRAQTLYKRALAINEAHAENLGNYALFVEHVRGNYDLAEALYRRAIAANQTHARNLGAFALFLKNVRGNYDEAEHWYRTAVMADPTDPVNLANFAVFLHHVRGRRDEAELFYREAARLDPDNPQHRANLTAFAYGVQTPQVESQP
jgi:tetratricopeptide (TPR) repeat protein